MSPFSAFMTQAPDSIYSPRETMQARLANVGSSMLVPQQLAALEAQRRQMAAVNSAFGQSLFDELLAPVAAPQQPEFGSLGPGTNADVQTLMPDSTVIPGPPMPKMGVPRGMTQAEPGSSFNFGDMQVDIGEPMMTRPGTSSMPGYDSSGFAVPAAPPSAMAPPSGFTASNLAAQARPRGPLPMPSTMEELALLREMMPELSKRRASQESTNRVVEQQRLAGEFGRERSRLNNAVALLKVGQQGMLEMAKLEVEGQKIKAKLKNGVKAGPDDIKWLEKAVDNARQAWSSAEQALNNGIAIGINGTDEGRARLADMQQSAQALRGAYEQYANTYNFALQARVGGGQKYLPPMQPGPNQPAPRAPTPAPTQSAPQAAAPPAPKQPSFNPSTGYE